MPRDARLVIPGCPHHVVHRGNDRQALFLIPEDRQAYLQRLQEAAQEYELLLWAYCLMTNHVHLITVPVQEESLARGIGQAHQQYSQWKGYRHGSSGHAWGNRFHSAPVAESHLWAAIRYVELNPVRAGVVTRAEDYLWSSARAHARGLADPVLSLKLPLGAPSFGPAWGEWLAEGLDATALDAIRRCTATGHPFGPPEFVAKASR